MTVDVWKSEKTKKVRSAMREFQSDNVLDRRLSRRTDTVGKPVNKTATKTVKTLF